jgi:hypothetical protein
MTRPLKGQLALWQAWKQQEYAIRTAEQGTLLDRFARWVEEHPEVVARAARVALQLKARGHRHYSVDGIWHILRWEHGLKAPSSTRSANPETPEVVDLNNDFTAPMARHLMERYPDLEGFFRTRRSQIDGSAA